MKRKPVFNLYYKIFFVLSFVSVFAVTAISLGQYAITRRALEKKSQDLNRSVVTMLMNDIDYCISRVETLSRQIANYQTVATLARNQYSLRVYRDIAAVTQLSTDLNSLALLNDDIEAIAVYSNKNSLCVGTNAIRTLSAGENEALAAYAGGMDAATEWIVGDDPLPFEQAGDFNADAEPDGSGETAGTVKMIYRLSLFGGDPLCVVVTMDKYALTQSIYDFRYEDGSVIILDQNDVPITWIGCARDSIGEIVQRMREAPGNVFEFEGEKFFYTSGNSEINQWRYVSFISQDDVFADIAQLDSMIAFLIFLLVMFVILFAVVAARRIYRPVEKFMDLLEEVPGEEKTDELSVLTSKVNHLIDTIYSQNELIEEIDEKARKVHLENEQTIKDNFIYRIMSGQMRRPQEILHACQLAGIDTQRHFVLVGIHMESLAPDSAGNDALLETTIELFRTVAGRECQLLKHFVSDAPGKEPGKRLICVLSLPPQENRTMTEKQVQTLCEFFQSMLRSQCGAQAFIGISGAVGDIAQLAQAYKQLQKVLRHEFVLGSDQVVSYRETQEDIHIFSLDKKIRAFRSALMAITDAASAQAAGSSLLEVRTDLLLAAQYEYFCKEVISAVYDFISQEVECNYELLQEVIGGFIRFDDTFENYEEFTRWISEILEKAVELKDKRLLTSHAIVNRALKYVGEHYDSVLSLTDVAGAVGVSDSYLSKIFKEHVKVSFKEYLTQMKMQKAKELLLETDLPVKEIGQRVGYNQTRQFSAIFTKLYGVTPSQFRRGEKPGES